MYTLLSTVLRHLGAHLASLGATSSVLVLSLLIAACYCGNTSIIVCDFMAMAAAMALLWHCAMELTSQCCGTAMATPGSARTLPWQCNGRNIDGSHMAAPWHCHGTAMAVPWLWQVLLWQCRDTAMECHGTTMALQWQCHGSAMAVPWQCRGDDVS